MKKLEIADTASNLLVLSSVMVAFTPFLLGDRLVPMAGTALRELTILFDQFSTYVTKLFG